MNLHFEENKFYQKLNSQGEWLFKCEQLVSSHHENSDAFGIELFIDPSRVSFNVNYTPYFGIDGFVEISQEQFLTRSQGFLQEEIRNRFISGRIQSCI